MVSPLVETFYDYGRKRRKRHVRVAYKTLIFAIATIRGENPLRFRIEYKLFVKLTRRMI